MIWRRFARSPIAYLLFLWNSRPSQGQASRVLLEWDSDLSTDYYIYRAPEDDTSQAVGLAAVTTNYFYDYTAEPAKQYYYWILAENQYGISFLSNSVTGFRSGPLPAASTNVSAADSAASTIEVTWDAVTNATGYRVSRSTSDTGPWEVLAEVDAGTLTFTDNSSLTQMVLYYYSVEAQNVMGYGAANIDAGSLGGDAPTSLQITSENTGGATMQWTAPGYAVTGYTILRSETDDVGAAVQVGSVAGDTLQFRDTSGEGATQYYYFVKATSDNGIESVSSASVLVSTTGVLVLRGGLMTVDGQRHLYMHFTNPLVEPPTLLFELSTDKVNWSPVDPADMQSLGAAEPYDARHEKLGVRLNDPISPSLERQYLRVTAQPQ